MVLFAICINYSMFKDSATDIANAALLIGLFLADDLI